LHEKVPGLSKSEPLIKKNGIFISNNSLVQNCFCSSGSYIKKLQEWFRGSSFIPQKDLHKFATEISLVFVIQSPSFVQQSKLLP